jgi:DNA modification methylase
MILLEGDCIELLPTLEDKSVDFVLTDPPYKLELHGGGKNDFGNRKLVKNKHISSISDSFDMDFVFGEMIRVMKKVNACIFCSNKQIKDIMEWWKKYSTTLLVWDKPNPTPLSNGKYISNLEFIVYVRGKGATFNNTGYENQLKTFRYPAPSPKARLHPTEKPVKLLERILRNHTNEHDVVLDMFMGSGSTGEACEKTNRNFIGMEINPTYYQKSRNRLS